MDNFNYQAYLKSGKLYNEDKQIISENEDPVKAYRDYVIHEKHYAQWNKNREQPTWWR